MAAITEIQKGQGATEYLVNLAVALFIATIVIGAMLWPNSSTPDVKKSQTDTKFKINMMKCSDIMSSTPCPDLIKGLVGYYKFDEGSGATTKDNRGGNTGTLTNTVWASGKSGSALSFNGANSVVTASGTFSTTDSASVAAWVNPASLSCSDLACTIFVAGSYGSVAGFHWFIINNGAIVWEYANGTAARSAALSYTAPLNTWTHLAATHDYSTKQVKFYVNGAQFGATQQATDSVLPVSATVRIGAYYSTYARSNGTIDEVMVYNRALSAEEVRLLYENPGYPQ